jgi:bifunctional non-homologous end joining protein LigD
MERISANDSRRSRERWSAYRTKRLSTVKSVAVGEDGVPSFNLLQNFGGADHTILFYAFDLLILASTDLRSRPLDQRRALLGELIPTLSDPIRLSETFDVPAAELLATVRQHGLEGVIAKRRNSTHRPGDRTGDWVKLRANRGQELVIGGYVPSSTTFDSILVGYYEGADLTYAARIRARIRSCHATEGIRSVSRFGDREMPVRESP